MDPFRKSSRNSSRKVFHGLLLKILQNMCIPWVASESLLEFPSESSLENLPEISTKTTQEKNFHEFLKKKNHPWNHPCILSGIISGKHSFRNFSFQGFFHKIKGSSRIFPNIIFRKYSTDSSRIFYTDSLNIFGNFFIISSQGFLFSLMNP